MATSSSPHFFKIILPQTLTEGKLYLPKKFVRDHGFSLLDSRSCLRLPTDEMWDVGLKKAAGKFWFQRGWPEFVDFYSIKAFHLLVFEYRGRNCSFHVKIFDRTATEICYPLRQPQPLTPKIEVEDDREGDGEGVGSLSKTMRERDLYNDLEVMEPEQQVRQPAPPLTENQINLLKRASRFRAETTNPSFMVTMRPSYIQTGSYLSLPRSFAERYLKESMNVVLQVPNGRVWRVWCGVRWAYSRRRTELKAGWKRFAVDNDLQEGDVCVFELIRNTKVALKVHIFRLDDQNAVGLLA